MTNLFNLRAPEIAKIRRFINQYATSYVDLEIKETQFQKFSFNESWELLFRSMLDYPHQNPCLVGRKVIIQENDRGLIHRVYPITDPTMYFVPESSRAQHPGFHPLHPDMKEKLLKALEPETEIENINADVSAEQARAVNRVVRAMNDGHCPNCGYMGMTTLFRKYNQHGYDMICPKCSFTITEQEAIEGLKLFHPYMKTSLDLFNEWRENDQTTA